MNKRRGPRRYPYGAATVALALAAGGGLPGCSTGHDASVDAKTVPAPLATPLATSVPTSVGTWATFPMGRLSQKKNTFWQLFFRPPASSSWSNKVEATATATNGGLVLASGGGPAMVVGVRPSLDLTFTPLISTSDGARSWSDGLISQRLAARPSALAAGAHGRMLALVSAGGGSEVIGTAGNLSAWRPLVTRRALAAGPAGRACGLTSLTAVGFLASRPVVAGACAEPGAVGIFSLREGQWRSAGPELGPALRRQGAQVLGMGRSQGRTWALLALSSPGGPALVACWSRAGGRWAVSPPLTLSPVERLASYGPGAAGGLYVLVRGRGGKERLSMSQQGRSWQLLAPPPAGTATLAEGAASALDAFVPSGKLLTISALAPGAHRWVKAQTVHVAIQYGSSS